MSIALATLLQGAIDYAGLFPPAKLDMAASMRNYLAYQDGQMVSRFACPSTRLTELLKHLPSGAEVPVAVIGQSGDWDDAREADAKLLNDFLDDGGNIAAYEVRVPDHKDLAGYLRDLNGFSSVDVFVELPWEGPMQDSLAQLAQSEFALAKARTGSEFVPSTQQLAGFLHGCVNLDWQFKLTAGLHHAFPTSGQHGLVSVLAGVALTLGADLSQRELQQVLEAESTQWRFGPETIACFEFEANLDDIEAARDLFVSVGSCSVEEPLQELESLGLVGGVER